MFVYKVAIVAITMDTSLQKSLPLIVQSSIVCHIIHPGMEAMHIFVMYLRDVRSNVSTTTPGTALTKWYEIKYWHDLQSIEIIESLLSTYLHYGGMIAVLYIAISHAELDAPPDKSYLAATVWSLPHISTF